jgi:hypothetical protein
VTSDTRRFYEESGVESDSIRMKYLITAAVVVAIAVATPFIVYIGFEAGALLFGPDRWYMSATAMVLFALLWIGWELRRIANHAADCSDKFDAVQTGITNVEDGVTTAGTDIVDAINMQAAIIKDEILEVENKLPD